MDVILSVIEYVSTPADENPQIDPAVASKAHFLGYLACIYSFLELVRALWTPTWFIRINKYEPSLEYDSILTYSSTEATLVGMALGACLLSQFLLYYRIRETFRVVKYSAIWGCGISILQATFTIVAFAMFLHRSREIPDYSSLTFSTGATALIISLVCALLCMVLYLLDATVLGKMERQATGHQKKHGLSSLLVTWYLILGAIMYRYIEKTDFETGLQFCVQTMLTIGYGRIVPLTTGGRIFTIVYGILGLCLLGFYVVSFEDSVVEHAHRETKIQYNLYQKARDRASRKRRSQFLSALNLDSDNLELDRYDSLETPLPLTSVPTVNSVISGVGTISSLSNLEPEESLVQKWRIWRVVIYITVFWLGSGGIFCWLQPGWTYLISIYFSFVTMTGIGFGDFVVTAPWALEYWYFFIFQAVAILSFIVGVVGEQVGTRFAKMQARYQAKRNAKRAKRAAGGGATQRRHHWPDRDNTIVVVPNSSSRQYNAYDTVNSVSALGRYAMSSLNQQQTATPQNRVADESGDVITQDESEAILSDD